VCVHIDSGASSVLNAHHIQRLDQVAGTIVVLIVVFNFLSSLHFYNMILLTSLQMLEKVENYGNLKGLSEDFPKRLLGKQVVEIEKLIKQAHSALYVFKSLNRKKKRKIL